MVLMTNDILISDAPSQSNPPPTIDPPLGTPFLYYTYILLCQIELAVIFISLFIWNLDSPPQCYSNDFQILCL